MLGEIIVKIFTPTTTDTSTATPAANSPAASAQPPSSQTSADSASVGPSTTTSTSAPAQAAAAPSASNAYDDLLNSDFGTDDETYTQLPSPIASAVDATPAIADVAASAPGALESVANPHDIREAVLEATAEVADVPVIVPAATNHASGQTTNGPSSSIGGIVSDAGNGVPLKIVNGVVAPSSGQTGSTTKLAEAVSSVGATITPTKQSDLAQAIHTSSSRAAAQSQPEVRISTTVKSNGSSDAVSEALKKSIKEQQKLAALQGVLGSDNKDGAGALFLLGQQSSQASSAADLVSILYSQH